MRVHFARGFRLFVLFSFLHQQLAFATHSLIELDFKDSPTPHRLHVIPRLSNVGDVSHVEIDTEKRQITVFRQEAPQLPEAEKRLPSVHPDANKERLIFIPHHNIQNLPWELEPEKLTLFIFNHTAWLTHLDEDGYKLEFRGRLLGGGKEPKGGTYPHTITITPDCNNPALGWSKTEICQKYKLHPPMPPVNNFLSMRHDDFRWMESFAEEMRYQSQMMIYNSQLMAHNSRVDQLLKEENEKLAQQRKKLKEKEDQEKQEQLEIEQQRQEYPVFYGEYEHFKKIHHLAGTEKSYETVFKYSDPLGYDRAFVKSIDWKRPFSFTEYLQSYNPFHGGYEEFKKIHFLAGTEKSYETVFKYSDPLGYDRSFVKSIDWKSTCTFEKYLQAYNPFYQDYSQIKEIHRLVNTVIYPEVFKYSTPLGYSEDFVKSIPYKEPMQPFESFMTEVFDDQVLEEWGAKNWRGVFRSTGDDAEFIQVGGKIDLIKEILKFGAQKGSGLLKQAWQKAVQAYKGEIVKGLKIDRQTLDKIPKELGDMQLNRKGVGVRWNDQKGKNYIRIDKGNPNHDLKSQRVNHVRINSNNQTLDCNGNPIKPTPEKPKPAFTEEAHIPYEIWKNWKEWNKP